MSGVMGDVVEVIAKVHKGTSVIHTRRVENIMWQLPGVDAVTVRRESQVDTDSIINALKLMDGGSREYFFERLHEAFCFHCYGKHTDGSCGCQCWNDE